MEAHRTPPRARSGLILGKFLPPHAGHLHLVDFARQYAEEVTVLVCSIAREPIPGILRHTWMTEMCPGCRVVHIDEELPQEPNEHPDFWAIWRRVIRQVLPEGPEVVFASEPYGQRLAEELGARFVPVDPSRGVVPISGTAIREAPLRYWRYIPAPVRPYFVKRVCVFGPESTGKTTLAADLAHHFDTTFVPEYARGLLDPKGGRCDAEDIPLIAQGQLASEAAAARQANRVLVSDTDLLTTTIWSDVLFGNCPDWIRQAARTQRYDITLLLDIDVPWVDDAQRYLAHRREEFFTLCREALEREGRRYIVIRGGWGARLKAAIRAVEEILVTP